MPLQVLKDMPLQRAIQRSLAVQHGAYAKMRNVWSIRVAWLPITLLPTIMKAGQEGFGRLVAFGEALCQLPCCLEREQLLGIPPG